MLPLYRDPHFTFRFADDRIIRRFHLEGSEASQRVSVFKLDARTDAQLERLATSVVEREEVVLPRNQKPDEPVE